MFIRLVFGDARVALVNTNCYCIHFVEYIRKQCLVPSTVDLLDICERDGKLMKLPETHPWENLMNVIPVDRDDPQQLFIPVAINIVSEEGHRRMWAMLDNLPELLPKCQENLELQEKQYNLKAHKSWKKRKREKEQEASPRSGKGSARSKP